LHRLLDAAGRAVKFLDINLRQDCYFRETITESLSKANILKLNLSEAHYLADLFEMPLGSLPEFCAEMMEEWSLSRCLVTLGEHGAFGASPDGTKVYVPGYEIQRRGHLRFRRRLFRRVSSTSTAGQIPGGVLPAWATRWARLSPRNEQANDTQTDGGCPTFLERQSPPLPRTSLRPFEAD